MKHESLASITTEADKAYMQAGAIPPSHMAHLQKHGTMYKGQTRADLMKANAEARVEIGLTERLPENKHTRREIIADTRRLKQAKSTATTATAPAKLSHRATVAQKKRESLNTLLDSVEARRKARELKHAETLGRRIAFRQEIGADAKAHEARNKALDAEADRLEAAARGETVTTAPAKSATVTKSKSVYDQYLAIKSGPERKAFLKANHAAIMHAVNTKEGNQ